MMTGLCSALYRYSSPLHDIEGTWRCDQPTFRAGDSMTLNTIYVPHHHIMMHIYKKRKVYCILFEYNRGRLRQYKFALHLLDTLPHERFANSMQYNTDPNIVSKSRFLGAVCVSSWQAASQPKVVVNRSLQCMFSGHIQEQSVLAFLIIHTQKND